MSIEDTERCAGQVFDVLGSEVGRLSAEITRLREALDVSIANKEIQSRGETITSLTNNLISYQNEITRLRKLVAVKDKQIQDRDAIFDDLDHVYKTLHAEHMRCKDLVMVKDEALAVFAIGNNWTCHNIHGYIFNYGELGTDPTELARTALEVK